MLISFVEKFRILGTNYVGFADQRGSRNTRKEKGSPFIVDVGNGEPETHISEDTVKHNNASTNSHTYGHNLVRTSGQV